MSARRRRWRKPLTERRWQAGAHIDPIDGVAYRVIPGTKDPRDLVLQHHIGGAWRSVKFRTVALGVDFLYDNEDVLYPPPALGGEYVVDYLRQAVVCGYEKADAVLHVDQQRRAIQARLWDGTP